VDYTATKIVTVSDETINKTTQVKDGKVRVDCDWKAPGQQTFHTNELEFFVRPKPEVWEFPCFKGSGCPPPYFANKPSKVVAPPLYHLHPEYEFQWFICMADDMIFKSTDSGFRSADAVSWTTHGALLEGYAETLKELDVDLRQQKSYANEWVGKDVRCTVKYNIMDDSGSTLITVVEIQSDPATVYPVSKPWVEGELTGIEGIPMTFTCKDQNPTPVVNPDSLNRTVWRHRIDSMPANTIPDVINHAYTFTPRRIHDDSKITCTEVFDNEVGNKIPDMTSIEVTVTIKHMTCPPDKKLIVEQNADGVDIAKCVYLDPPKFEVVGGRRQYDNRYLVADGAFVTLKCLSQTTVAVFKTTWSESDGLTTIQEAEDLLTYGRFFYHNDELNEYWCAQKYDNENSVFRQSIKEKFKVVNEHRITGNKVFFVGDAVVLECTDPRNSDFDYDDAQFASGTVALWWVNGEYDTIHGMSSLLWDTYERLGPLTIEQHGTEVMCSLNTKGRRWVSTSNLSQSN
jgi:hypothetical protein